ncbi:hypothetical protein [Nocardia sp. CA-119907]
MTFELDRTECGVGRAAMGLIMPVIFRILGGGKRMREICDHHITWALAV